MNWKKFVLIGLALGAIAFTAAPRAEAGVSVNIGFGPTGYGYYRCAPAYYPYGYNYYRSPRRHYYGPRRHYYRPRRVAYVGPRHYRHHSRHYYARRHHRAWR